MEFREEGPSLGAESSNYPPHDHDGSWGVFIFGYIAIKIILAVITPNGRQVLVITPAASQTESNQRPMLQINVVSNWFGELKQRVPVR
ncbi:MAG: hypothetical protein DMG12_04655 [Acidobacteria bacterium]|nr:MAG: hypothetical protein DMG12_04655 [Acidobacteriota bacterium]